MTPTEQALASERETSGFAALGTSRFSLPSKQRRARLVLLTAFACSGAGLLGCVTSLASGSSFVLGTSARGHASAPGRLAKQLPGVKDPLPLDEDGFHDSNTGLGATAWASAAVLAAAVAAARLARTFSRAVPLRTAAARNVASHARVVSAGGSCSVVSCGRVSSSSSSFLGSSLAGSVTPAVPAPTGSAVASMTMMFERFSEKAIKAVMLAQEESRRLRHNYCGTEMLLVGVIAENTGVAAKVLKKLGVTIKDARKVVEELIGRGEGVLSPEIPFTPTAKRLLSSSVEESKQTNSSTVDPSHILLALVKDEDGKAAEVFKKLGVEASKVSEEIAAEILETKVSDEREPVGVSTKGGGSKSSGSMLEEFGKDLTKAALDGQVDPLVGREEEIDRTIQILARRQKNNPVLIGEPGVGKTAIAEGLSYKIATGDVPEMLVGKRIVLLDLGMLLSGTKYRGEFEERLKNIVKEAKEDKNGVILMIDEIHTLVGAGGSGDGGGAMDAANILKPALSRGELQLIGATTVEEYRKHIEKDKALERRFQPVTVPEPTVEQTIDILRGLARKYEAHHKLRYSEEALVSCVKLASQYITDRFLPDKAIDVLDETGARVSLRQLAKIPEEAKNVRMELREVQASKDQAVSAQDFVKAGELRAKELELLLAVQQIVAAEATTEVSSDALGTSTEGAAPSEAPSDPSKSPEAAPATSEAAPTLPPAPTVPMPTAEAPMEPVVVEADVANVVSTWTGVPVDKVTSDESQRLVALEETLHNRVIGQEEAVVAVSKAVRRARAGLKNPNRPIASFIFCGPTGVGKTELCKALADAYFGKEESMIRLDMSEFMERHTVSKLIGSPPGYVGYDEESQLTDGVRRKPYSLVLFDEVEKAHPDVFNLCLQILDDGRLTDSKGRVVSFKNTLIIMTSNVGAKAIEKQLLGGGDLGFSGMEEDDAGASSYGRLKSMVHSELKNFFRPEFLNRLDEIIVFKSLTLPEVGEIAELEFRKTFKRCVERGITLSLTERFKKKVIQEGFNPVYGARPLRRAITRLLEDKLAESFLNEPTVEGEYVLCDLDSSGEIVVLRQCIKEAGGEAEGDEGKQGSIASEAKVLQSAA